MNIKHSEYVLSAVTAKQYPKEGYPEVALVGRSNVGKSSFINKLLTRKNLARTSSRPGKTQTLNFYLINRSFYLVDLPGYGYARVSKEIQSTWGKMMEEYLSSRETLQLVIQLLDVRHPPSLLDQQMWQWLAAHQKEVLPVATKYDKIAKTKRQQHLNIIRKTLQVPPDQKVLPFSSLSGEGKDEVWQSIRPYVTS